MSYVTCVVGDIIAIRWIKPEPGDAAAMLRITQTARARVGRELLGIAVLDTAQAIPSEEVRAEMERLVAPLMQELRGLRYVVLANGFTFSRLVMQIVLHFMSIASRNKIDTHKTLEEALMKEAETAPLPYPIPEIKRQLMAAAVLPPFGKASFSALARP